MNEQLRILESQLISTPTQVYNDAIDSGKYEFSLSRTDGPLVRAFIKATVRTSAAVVIGNQTEYGFRLLDTIRFHNGVSTIQTLNFRNSIARYDAILSYELYEKIKTGVSTSGANFGLGNIDVVLFIPLFFSFGDSLEHAFDVSKAQYFIEITTAKNSASRAMSINLSYAKYELITFYSQLVIPKSIKPVYSVFQEPRVFCPSEAARSISTVKIRMTCPYKVFSLNFMIEGITVGAHKSKITNISINAPNWKKVNIDDKINYKMNTSIGYNQSSSFTYEITSRNSPGLGLKFSQEMYPTEIIVTFENLNEDSYLYTNCEYWVDLVDNNGIIEQGTSGLFL